jgi:hypothetical protein
MRDGDWKLLVMRDGSNPKLFNLQDDAGETNNQAAIRPDIAARMTEALLSWWRTLPAAQVSLHQPVKPADHGL